MDGIEKFRSQEFKQTTAQNVNRYITYRRVWLLSAYAYKIQRKASFINILFIKRIRLINDHNTWSFAAMDSLHWDSVIRGHHVHKDIWTPFIGEDLRVEQETHNVQDRFDVAVVKHNITVGIVPHEVLRLVWHFIGHDGTVNCEVTGRRKHGLD